MFNSLNVKIMKKVLMIAAMMIATLSASAQNEVGQITLKPTVGMNIASITKVDYSKVRPGLIAGVEAEYGIAKNFGVTAGLFYSMQGVKEEYNRSEEILGVPVSIDTKATSKLDFLNIPIMAQYYIVKGLAVKAGAQIGFCVSKKYDAEISASVSDYSDKEAGSGKFEDGVKSPVFSVPVGLSYEYQGFVLDARYNLGVTKALDNFDGRHSVFTFTLGYKFAL